MVSHVLQVHVRWPPAPGVQSQGIHPTRTWFGVRRWPFGQRLGARSHRATPEIFAQAFEQRYGSGRRPVRRESGKHRPASETF